MKYTIREAGAFSVIGQEVELTDSQRKNIQVCKQFWRLFNLNLKKNYLTQYENWLKYAFMERRSKRLFYYCAISKRAVIPNGFILKEIPASKYLVAEHIGNMDSLYDTYTKLYKDLLLNTRHELLQRDFLHFERYDYRFCWNKENSIIELWLPIKDE